MDWFSWLSKTNLDPSLTYEYALAFAKNELEQDDIPYFNHGFLQSMGVSIAKHRLEILKLATAERKKNKRALIRPVLWFRFAINQTKSYLTKKIKTFVVHHRHHDRDNSPISLVPPKRNHSLRWKVAMLQRNNMLKTHLAKPDWPIVLGDDDDDDDDDDGSTRFVSSNNGIMMLTNGSPTRGGSRTSESSRSSDSAESEANAESGNPWKSSFSRTTVRSTDGENWSSSTEEIKWDSMFKNLKPT